MRSSYFARVLVHSRTKLPLLSSTLAFVSGQAAGLIGSGAAAIVLVLHLAVIFVVPGDTRRRLIDLTLCLCGAAGGLLLVLPPGELPASGRPHLALVDAKPRHPRVGEAVLSLKLLDNQNPARILCRAVHLPWRNSSRLRGGETILFTARFRPLDGGTFSYDGTLRRQGYSAACRIRYLRLSRERRVLPGESVREKLVHDARAVLGNGERAGLLLAMAFGTRDAISDRTEEAFRRTGLAHLLVLSGYQVTLLFGFLNFGMLRVMRNAAFLRDRVNIALISSAASFLFCCAFVFFTSIEHSSTRAIIAASLVTLTAQLERGAGYFHCLCSAFLIMSVLWPGCYLEPGVQLTFTALIGIGLSLQPQRGSAFSDYLRMCLYASLFTSIVALVWFDGISLSGFVLNPILAPAFSFLSCNVGFPAMGLYSAGMHSWGAGLLIFAADSLETLRDCVLCLAGFEWGFLELQGIPKYCAAALLSVAAGYIVFRRARENLILHGVRPARSSDAKLAHLAQVVDYRADTAHHAA